MSLQPGGRQQWSLQIQAGRMGLRTYGVYPIAVDVVNPVTGMVVDDDSTADVALDATVCAPRLFDALILMRRRAPTSSSPWPTATRRWRPPSPRRT